jgi:hypothetical protein
VLPASAEEPPKITPEDGFRSQSGGLGPKNALK